MVDFDVQEWAIDHVADKLNTSLFSYNISNDGSKKKRKCTEATKSLERLAQIHDHDPSSKRGKLKQTSCETESIPSTLQHNNKLVKENKKKRKMLGLEKGSHIEKSMKEKETCKSEMPDACRQAKRRKKGEDASSRINHCEKKTQQITDDLLTLSVDANNLKKKRRKKKKNSNKKNKYAHLGRKSLSTDNQDSENNVKLKNTECVYSGTLEFTYSTGDHKNRTRSTSDQSDRNKTNIKLKKHDKCDTGGERLPTPQQKYPDSVVNKKSNKTKLKFENKEVNVENKTLVEKMANKRDKKFNIETLGRILKGDNSKTMLKSDKEHKSKNTKTNGKSEEEEEEEEEEKVNPSKTMIQRMQEQLQSARFRYLNEQLYSQTGQQSLHLFKDDQEAFEVYHQGFSSQVSKWPVNPVDVLIQQIKTKPQNCVIADFGCGDAKIARSVKNRVHSFDLMAMNKHVTACDMSKVPLKKETVDIAVFCLSLMGTNLSDYLQEAYRVLKPGGTLKVAEVVSRFKSLPKFIKAMEKMGFKVQHQETENKMFWMFDFKKLKKVSALQLPVKFFLDPCVYKKR